MLSFILRRLVVAIPTLFLVITLAFFMMRLAPGSPFDSGTRMTPEVRKNLEAKFGFDEPLPVQYGRYLVGIAHGDFGPSLKYKGKSVGDFIKEGFPTSLKIGASALGIAGVIGIGLGIWAALRQNSATDYVATGIAILGVCIPTFVTAPLLILLFASKLGWLPNGGITGGFKSFILPVAVLALPQIAIISRLTRAGMIEALRSNYVRTARAKGLPARVVVTRHALRAALIPLVSYLGPAAAGLITGSLVVERLFGLPGLGKSFILGALQRDYPVVMGVVILYAALILLLNLIADVCVALLDPRVRLS
jgi:oligopeptide transport system permease protein